MRSGGEEGGLPQPAGGGGTPVPVLLTQLLLKQRHLFPVTILSGIQKKVVDLDPDGSAFI